MELTLKELKKEFKYINCKMNISYIRNMTLEFLNKKGCSAIAIIFQDLDFYNNFEEYFKNCTKDDLYVFHKEFNFVYNLYNKFKLKMLHNVNKRVDK